ncbi:MAG: hypothetical protein P8Y13_02345 [Deinococcales bacterium]|jgi:hypothetical protein
MSCAVPGVGRTRVPPLAALVLVAAWALLAPYACATTYLQLTPEAMLAKASLVFVGTVSDVSVKNDNGTPWTHVSFTVDVALKGVSVDAQGQATQPVELAFLGGSVPGGPALTVGGMPQFTKGEKVLVFAYDQAYASPIVGFRQALWRVTPAGLQDEDGQLLSLTDSGKLVSGGSGAPLDSIVTAIRDALGSSGGTP